MNSDEEINKEKLGSVRAMIIIEVIGRPPEHLTETLNNIIKQIDEEKGISVKEKTLHEPKLLKDKKDFYSSFAEVEVETEEILHVARIMFKYMPSHIEILSPENLRLSNNDLNDIFNEITRRLHQYDEIARVVQIEKAVLEKKLKGLLGDKEGNSVESNPTS